MENVRNVSKTTTEKICIVSSLRGGKKSMIFYARFCLWDEE
jgi:hypothetical protein